MSYNEENVEETTDISEDINEETIFGENEVAELDNDIEIEDEIMDEVDHDIEAMHDEEGEYEYFTADDIPDYTLKSVVAIIFCLPLGILSLSYAKKVKQALAEDDLQAAIEHSEKAGLFFKISIFLVIILALVVPFSLKLFVLNDEAPKDVIEEVAAPEKVRIIPQWENSAKRIINLEKAFYVNNSFYRYYYSQEISNDEILGFRFNENIEKHHYMTKIENDQLSVIIYEIGKTPETGESYIMDADYNIKPYAEKEEATEETK